MAVFSVQVEELDLPVKRNQAFIVTYFSKTREKFCDHLLGEGEKKREERKELLIKVLDYPLLVLREGEISHVLVML